MNYKCTRGFENHNGDHNYKEGEIISEDDFNLLYPAEKVNFKQTGDDETSSTSEISEDDGQDIATGMIAGGLAEDLTGQDNVPDSPPAPEQEQADGFGGFGGGSDGGGGASGDF